MTDYKELLDDGIYDIKMGYYERSVEKITKSIALKNDWEIPYFYRAVAHQAMEKFDEAILDYTKALQINTRMTDAYYNRAYIMLTRKDISNPNLNKIIADLEKAIELDKKFIDALYAMAVAYKRMENYQKALEYLDKILQIEPFAVNAKALKKLILQKYVD